MTDNSLTLAPPEYDLKQEISQSFDIWSLGCVYLEFVTWMLLGADGLEKFRQIRLDDTGSRPKLRIDNFYALMGKGKNRHAKVKESVETVSYSYHAI